MNPRAPAFLFAAASVFCTSGCVTIKHTAIDRLADALASGGGSYGQDDDPQLIQSAAPFSLKLMESLLAERPQHRGLLLAAASGFTQYAFAFVQQEGDEVAEKDFAAGAAIRQRACRLYLRGRDYGLRGLEGSHPGITGRLRTNPRAAVAAARTTDVPLLYWTAAAWGLAIALSKDNADLLADLPIVEALIDRAVELDESFEHGALHGFLIAYEMARPGLAGDPATRSRQHFDRATVLTGGQQAAPFVALAESVTVARQNRAEFESLLRQALAVNVGARPEWRLSNLVMQRRARWLLSRVDELFLPATAETK